MAAPKVKAPPPELIAAPKGAPKAKAAPTPEQCAEWRDNPSLEKLGLMTDAALILAAKPEDKARLDAYLRELRSTKTEEELQRLPMMWAPLPTRSAPARPELTSGLSASSVPPSEPPAESLRLDLCHGCALDAAGIDDDGSTVAENYLQRRRVAFNTLYPCIQDYHHMLWHPGLNELGLTTCSKCGPFPLPSINQQLKQAGGALG